MFLNDNFVRFSEKITWSVLSGIGNSRFAQLTVLMPVLGYLVVFNAEISKWLEIVIPREATREVPSYWHGLSESNLTYLYFGLLIFGVAVIVFNAVAPKQIRRFPNFESYIHNMLPIATTQVVEDSFMRVTYGFLDNLRGERRSAFFDAREASFPPQVTDGFHSLVENAFRKVMSAAVGSEIWQEGFGSQHITGTGDVETGIVVEDMMRGDRGAIGFKSDLVSEIVKEPRDVFYIEHSFLEHSRPILRTTIFVLFGVGLTFMAFPTFVTAMIILGS